jgi:hypothetical protein
MKLLFGGFARAKTLQGPCRILFYPTLTPYVLSDKILSPFSIIFFYFSTSIGNVGTSNKDNKFIGIIIIIIMKFITVIFFLSALCCSIANAFSSSSTTQVTTSLLPTFDKKTQRWSPAEGSEEEPYGLGRTLLGNGPVPAFTRITQSDDYMQAVLKFQANEKSTIRYAQGNMDAYFENPNVGFCVLCIVLYCIVLYCIVLYSIVIFAERIPITVIISRILVVFMSHIYTY